VPALQLEELARNHGERRVLSGVTLTLEEGQTLVVFGPNGAGKTTLLRVLATLLRPHGGSVRVFERALPGEAWAVRGRIGMLGHEPMLYRELSARENLLYHARLHGLARARVSEMLERVGMRDRADEPLRTLSRGMVQRVAIARSVLHDPELLLLDEPYAHLDPAAREIVEELLCAEGRSEIGQRTRVISSHDPTGGLAEADLVLGLRAGRVAVLRERAAVRSSELAELYR
jgi:heme exporter protein A